MRRSIIAGRPALTRTVTALLATALLVALSATPASASWHGPRPGSAGVGDSYFPDSGNGGYDVEHYDVNLRYDPATDALSGTTTITARATHGLSQFNLDFLLDVSSVMVNGRAAAFSMAGSHELIVIPARPPRPGQRFTTVITYAGIPSTVTDDDGFTAWHRTADGALAVGQPEIAWWWFPSNDHPSDKATFAVSIVVPDGVEVISNGVQINTPLRQPSGWTRWSWRTTSPIATYLAFLAVGQYDLVTSTAPNGQPVVNAFSTALGTAGTSARTAVGRTAEIVAWASDLLGRYPFETQGGVVAPPESLMFALENATRPVYSSAFWRVGANTSVVVHEIAHQWFGDNVSVARWQDIWLNEGFATYITWMWAEAQGQGTAQEFFDYTYASYAGGSAFWQVLPGNPGPDRLFHTAVYDRGAMAVHQIRVAIGDDAFLRVLRRWTALHAGGAGTVGQFHALAEWMSGHNLDSVFATWLYTAGRPAYVPKPVVVEEPQTPFAADVPAEPATAATAVSSANAVMPVKPAAWDEVSQVTAGEH